MKDLQWFPPIPEPRAALAAPVLGSVLVGTSLGAVLLARGHRLPAIFVWATTFLLTLGLYFPVSRAPILRAAHWLGAVAGRITTLAVLWPFYVLIFGSIRLALSLTRVDVLGLRLHREWSSYWQPAVPEQRRAKYYQRLFTVEPARQESHPAAWMIGILAFVIALAGAGESVLRSMGFGNPILYRVDPRVGYYAAPNQNVHRYGGNIHINAFGMRSSDITAAKPSGTFRILMLGDSTLYGGSYIDQSQMYATRLEGLLNQNPSALPTSPRRVEVLCMGVNAWGPQHELAYVQEFGLFDADLVMVMGPPADAYRPRYGIEQLPFDAEGSGPRFAWQEFWDHLLWEHNLRNTGAGAPFEARQDAATTLVDGVAAWLAITTIAKAPGAGVDFELLPNQEEAEAGRASEATKRVLDALLPELAMKKVPYVYALPFLRGNLGVAGLYHDGVHLGAPGHKIYANYLRDRVMQWASSK